jgi:hypothetical protein
MQKQKIILLVFDFVPQNVIDIELCLRITSGFTTLTPFVKARQNAYVCSMKSVCSMPFAARKIDLLIGGK